MLGVLTGWVGATPTEFDIPAGPAAPALLRFAAQARLEVLFRYDVLQRVTSPGLRGIHEPAAGLARLLVGTGFGAQLTADGKFVITAQAVSALASVHGTLLGENGQPLGGARVALPSLQRVTVTDADGIFMFLGLPAGRYRLVVSAESYRPIEFRAIDLAPGESLALAPQQLPHASGVTELEPMLVEATAARLGRFTTRSTPFAPRQAGGNLDLTRTEDDVLPFTIYERDEIARSGVVNLNDFLQRELLEASSSGSSPESSTSGAPFLAGSTNLSLRGFGNDETVILLNGRRLPEVLTTGTGNLPPDVNFIPLSLVQQVQVLPVSSAALYNGNAVGGVINIVLRPDVVAAVNEVTTTYVTPLAGFDAPEKSTSFLHGSGLGGGRFRYRLSASFTDSLPPVEAELGYRAGRLASETVTRFDPLARATPNLRTPDGSPLFGSGSPSVTSVAPGADGSGGLASFAGREGVRNFALFDSPGGFAAATNSTDNGYGRRQQRSVYFLSVVFDAWTWLQLGLDVAYAHTTIGRGFDVLTADLPLGADAAANPFGVPLRVTLNETAPLLGEGYSEARLDFFSGVVSALITLPGGWQSTADLQHARSQARYRGLAGANEDRWAAMAASGEYPLFRDTQLFGPPPAFYDRVIIYEGARGEFVSVGDYDTIDATWRLSHAALPLPTGLGRAHGGLDYRRNELAAQRNERRYGDGELAEEPILYTGRSIERVSVFGEVVASLWPLHRLPVWITAINGDLAARYTIGETAAESNFSPTFGLKLDFASGWALRASVTTSDRFPSPNLTRRAGSGTGGGVGIATALITDPRRGGAQYDVETRDDANPELSAETAVTQSAGLIYAAGERVRLRLALDYADTRKTDEIVGLNPSEVVNLESFFPERVDRAPAAPGDPFGTGLITAVLTGTTNLASRHSQTWSISADALVTEILGGTLELRTRLLWFQKYDRVVLPNTPVIDELAAPSGSASGLLRSRASLGAGWSNDRFGVGIDGYYFASRLLPPAETIAQGRDSVADYWQWDVYAQVDVSAWLSRKTRGPRLKLVGRVNNVFDAAFPAYASHPSGAGVQPYGDWRGPTLSLSLTAEF